MNASGFEPSAPDDPGPPLSHVLGLKEEHGLEYATLAAIAIAVAVVKHVARLVILIVALATSVVIYCFVLCWLCLLYVQTRLLLLNSTMLRLCMDEPRRELSVVAEPVHPPELTLEEELDDLLTTPQAAEEAQSGVDHVIERAITEEQCQDLSPASKPHLPKFHEEWTTPTLYSEGRPLPEDVDEYSAITGSEIKEETKQAGWASFGQTYKPASEHWSGEEEPWRHDKYEEDFEGAEDWEPMGFSNQVPSATSLAPKLSKEEQKAQAQRSWLDQMHASPPKASRGRTTQTTRPTTHPAPLSKKPTNPFTTTADQLDEVRRFNNDATKGGQKGKLRQGNQRSNAPALRQNRPGSSHVQEMQGGDMTLASSFAHKGVSDRAAVMSASTSRTVEPPHQKAAAEGRARTAAAAAAASSSLAQPGPSSNFAVPQAAITQDREAQGHGQPAVAAAGSAAGQDVETGDSSQPANASTRSDSTETRERATELNESPMRLGFYEGTPAVSNAAAMSAEYLKSRRSDARMPEKAQELQPKAEQAQELQPKGSDAALNDFGSHTHVHVPATMPPVSAAPLSDTTLLAPALTLDLHAANTFPSLSLTKASSEGQITRMPKPPGLGEARPKRQAVFDALLSETSPITPQVQSHSEVRELETPINPVFEPIQSTKPATNEAIAMGVFEPIQFMKPATNKAIAMGSLATSAKSETSDLTSLKESAQMFKLPDFGPKSGHDSPPHLREASILVDEKMRNDTAIGQKTAKGSDGDEITDAVTRPQEDRTEADRTEADDGRVTQEDPVAASDSKRAKREKKKEAREDLLEAWCIRDDARRKLASSWSIELATLFRKMTGHYHECRDDLASLMGNGELNEEDAKAFPRYTDMDLGAPKHRPKGAAELQRKRRENKLPSAVVDAGDVGDAGGAGGEDSTGSPSPGRHDFDDLKSKLKTARKLRQDAVDYFKQPRPQSNVSYQTWKAKGDAKLDRANKLYRSKRKDLVEAFSGELPEDLAAEFPLL